MDRICSLQFAPIKPQRQLLRAVSSSSISTVQSTYFANDFYMVNKQGDHKASVRRILDELLIKILKESKHL